MILRSKILSLLFLAIIFISPLACSDAKTSASYPEYDKALQSAKRDGKPVMLFFSSKYCPYCTMMEQNTLADKEITRILSGFHVVKIEAERNSALARSYSVNVFPTFWFLEGSGKRIVEAPGYMDKSLFKKLLEYVKGNHYKTQDIYKYLKRQGQ